MDQKDEMHHLSAQAREGLQKLDLPNDQKRTDLLFIEAMAEEGDVERLRVFAAHAGVFRPEMILGVNLYVALADITSEHLWVYGEIDQAYEDNLFGNKSEQRVLDEFTVVLVHALRHIKDGRIIISLIKDRGIVRLDDIVEALPALRSNGVTALTEGIL